MTLSKILPFLIFFFETTWLRSEALPENPPLATKQEIIRDRVLRLEDQMYRLIEKLKEQDPQQAVKLETTLRKMGELGLRRGLNELIDTLKNNRLGQAQTQQQQLLDDLNTLLTLLVSDAQDPASREKEIETLREQLAKVKQLLQKESELLERTGKTQKSADGQPADAQAAQTIQQLLQNQQSLYQETSDKKNQKPGTRDTPALTSDQQKLADQAEQLAKFLEEKKESSAQETAQNAQESMSEAQQALEKDQFGVATDAQEDALEELRQALEKLTKKPSPAEASSELEKIAQEQEKTSQQTGQLAEEMDTQPHADPANPPTGQPQVEQAREWMNQAKKQLDDQQPDQARQAQQQSIQSLQKAQQQVEQKLSQLQQQQQQQKLDELKKQFEAMLMQQQAINAATNDLGRTEAAQWQRTQQLQAIELGQQENSLGKRADDCLNILTTDDSTVVFPQLVEQLRDDFYEASQRLANAQVDPITQNLQTDIVTTLEVLLASLEQAQSKNQNNSAQQPGEGQQGDPPLLPSSAEIKLLANLQERLYHRTKRYHQTQQQDAAQIQRLTDKQKEVADLANQMNEKIKKKAVN